EPRGQEREPQDGPGRAEPELGGTPGRDPQPPEGGAEAPAHDAQAPSPGPDRTAWVTAPGRRLAGCVLLLVLLAAVTIGGLLLLFERRPRLTEAAADSLVTSVLQREARRSFLVTGSLDLAITTRVRTATKLLPGILDLSLGTTES